MPIRGEYQLAVDVVADDGRQVRKAFSFKVRENRKKWLALGAFSAGLFVLGFVSGRIFTGAKGPVVSLIATALLAASPVISHVPQQGSGGTTGLEIEPASVGKPSLVRWSLPRNGGGDGAVVLTLTITHQEKQKVVFAIEKVPVTGAWSMKFHFPDGAEYRVTAVADSPGLTPVRSEQVISVTGVEPPTKAMVPVLLYFLAVIVLGLSAGRWTKHRTAAR